MAFNVENIGAAAAEVTGGFTHTEVYIAKLADFDVMTQPKDKEGANAAINLGELVTITADHTFLAGKGFTKVKAIQESIKLETAQIGTKQQPVMENKLTFQMLGSKSDILGFKRWVKGEDVIVLATEFGTGQIRQIGSPRYAGSLLEGSGMIDGTIEGENTSTFVFQDKQMHDAAIYEGAITLQPAV